MNVLCSLLNHWACYFTFAVIFQRYIQISAAKCMCVCQRKILQPSRVRFTTPESSYRITPEYKLFPLERLAGTRQCCWQQLHQYYFKQMEFRSDSMKRQFWTRFSPKGFPPNIWSLGRKAKVWAEYLPGLPEEKFLSNFTSKGIGNLCRRWAPQTGSSEMGDEAVEEHCFLRGWLHVQHMRLEACIMKTPKAPHLSGSIWRW